MGQSPKIGRVALVAVAAACLLGAMPQIAGANGGPKSANDCPGLRKLGRGATNTLFGLLEVPIQMRKVGAEKGQLAGATWGLLVGAASALVRTGAGIFEVVTFPIPLKDVGWGPLVQPEFLLQPGSPQLTSE